MEISLKDTKSTKERILWIDIMKVLGIFTIVWGHFFPGGYVSAFLFSFNVPLFFMISGYLCKKQYPIFILLKKLLPIILLYLIICTLNYGINLLYAIVNERATEPHFYDFIIGILGGATFYKGTMWFVYTLIITRVIHNTFLKHKEMLILISIICLLAVCYIPFMKSDNAIKAVALAFPFFEIGFFLNSRCGDVIYKKIKLCRPIFMLPFVILFMAVLYIAGRYNGIPHIYMNDYGNSLFVLMICSVIGYYMTMILSLYIISISTKKMDDFFNIMARANIIILGFHGLLIPIIQGLISSITSNKLSIFVLQFLGAIMIMLILYPINLFYCRHIEPILFHSTELSS